MKLVYCNSCDGLREAIGHDIGAYSCEKYCGDCIREFIEADMTHNKAALAARQERSRAKNMPPKHKFRA